MFNMNIVFRNFLGFVMLMLSAFAVSGEDEGLYDPVVGADEALIRVLNLETKALTITISDKVITDIAPSSFSQYIRVKAGEVVIEGDRILSSAGVKMKAKAAYTVAIRDQNIVKAIEDSTISKRGKAMLALYNFSQASAVTLKTLDGKTAIVADVGLEARGHREVNAIKIQMAVFSGPTDDIKLGATGEVNLRKDQVLNVLVTGDDINPQVRTLFSTTNTRI